MITTTRIEEPREGTFVINKAVEDVPERICHTMDFTSKKDRDGRGELEEPSEVVAAD